MKLLIENIGMIKKSEILIEGITVLAGENDTGKSTIGKVLFSIFSSMHDKKNKIKNETQSEIEDIMLYNFRDAFFSTLGNKSISKVKDSIYDSIKKTFNFKKTKRENIDNIFNALESEIDKYFIDNIRKKIKYEQIMKCSEEIYGVLSITEDLYIEKILSKTFNIVFNKQINNFFTSEDAKIELNIENEIFKIEIKKNSDFKIKKLFNVDKDVVYIDTPFVLDELDDIFDIFGDSELSPRGNLRHKLSYKMESNTIKEIFNEYKIKDIISKLDLGTININFDKTVYRKNNSNIGFNIKNVSAGIKTFIIIKELIVKNLIEKEGVIILDEPEIHLHPKWQLIFAELIVLLQKEFNLNILLTTHSPYFLNAIEVYSKKHNIENKCNYYISEKKENFAFFENVNNNLKKIYSKLIMPIQELENESYR